MYLRKEEIDLLEQELEAILEWEGESDRPDDYYSTIRHILRKVRIERDKRNKKKQSKWDRFLSPEYHAN